MPSSRLASSLIPIAVCLGLATVAVYAQVRSFGFVWDDRTYVVENEGIRHGFSADGLRFAFTSAGYAMNWHPVTWLSHALDYQLFGLEPAGHHLMNVAIHVANVLLLLLLMVWWTGRLGPSALVAGLFALHPVHIESVAWVAERKDTLSMLLALVAMAAYTAYARRGGVDRYLAVVVASALAMMAKPMMVTLPALLLLLDAWPLRRDESRDGSWRRLVLEKLPLLALSFATVAMTLLAQSRGDAIASTDVIGVGDRVANAVVSYARYLGHLAWPRDLAALYPHPSLPGGVPLTPAVVAASGALLLGVTAVAVRFRRLRYPLAGWCWFLGTLVPVIGLVHVGVQAMADRYAYLSFVGLYIAISFGMADSLDRRLTRRRARVAFAVVAVAWLGALAWTTHRDAARWRDPISLFSHSIAHTGGSPKAHYNLGVALVDAGRVDEGMAQYRVAIAEKPSSPLAHNNLGILLAKRGEVDEATDHFREALRYDPGIVSAHVNLAQALRLGGDVDAAIEHLDQAVRLDPDSGEALTLLAWSLATAATITEQAARDALLLAERAVRATGRAPEALDALAAAAAASGQFERAVRVAEEAASAAHRRGDARRAAAIRGRREAYARRERHHEPVAPTPRGD